MGIIRQQGNRFIKELLRVNGISIGNNKEDFENNLLAAIEEGRLHLADVEAWSANVEGWGNQHVYLFRLPRHAARLLARDPINSAAAAAGLTDYLGASPVMQFPDEPSLSSIDHDGNRLSIVWQEATAYWSRDSSHDYQAEEGLDLFEYRAYRRMEDRVVTRFEAREDLGLAAIFIPNPVKDEEHMRAFDEVKRVVNLLVGGELMEDQLDISIMSRNLDQHTMSLDNQTITTQRSRLTAGGAHVEFAADSPDRGYGEENAVRQVRRSIRDQQIGAFRGTGSFIFHSGAGEVARQLRVGLYGSDFRIRLWAQMTSDEVWSILSQLAPHA